MSDAGRAAPVFEIVPNPSARAPLSFEDEGHHRTVPHMGSTDLLLIAEAIEASGLNVLAFYIVDATMTRLGQSEEGLVSEDLIDTFRRFGALATRDLLAVEYRGYAVIGVEFRLRSLDSFLLQRDGVAAGNAIDRLDLRQALAHALQKAWYAVKFS